MCGTEVPFTRKVNVDGTVLLVCPECARFGREVKEVRTAGTSAGRKQTSLPKKPKKDIYAKMERELIPDYHKVIARARQKMGLTQKELAAKISERKSVVAAVESGHMRPEDALVRKLEKALRIKLIEEVEAVPVSSKKGDGGLTLGDLIKIKKD